MTQRTSFAIDADLSKDSFDDLVLLNDMSTQGVNDALSKRFKNDKIYTKIGRVLISVNPFKDIKGMYSPELIPKFQNRFMHEVQPHIFSLSEDAYRALLRGKEDQCIIITGESGSGKTEASKKIMQYVAAVSGNSQEILKVKDQLLKSNPVLEAFGNAKTLRNDNSSRFGKYLEIFFNHGGDPVGGKIRNFLLEKNRVVNASKGERNFHIFYQLLRGCQPTLAKKLHLKDPSFYNYLSKTGMYDLGNGSGKRDISEFKETRDGLEALGINSDLQEQIFSIISAILWIGQIEFEGTEKASIKKSSDDTIAIVAELLKVDKKMLVQCLCKRETKAPGGDIITRILRPIEAMHTRDALSKVIYFRLFDWLLGKINLAIEPSQSSMNSIGVLDIYGFEIFEENSFEQFCINYVNEKLQQVFIERTLKIEQEEYSKEGIEWTPVQYFNNKIVCDLIEKHQQGILSYLDETCIVPKGTDLFFTQKVIDNLATHEHLIPPTVKDSQTSFTIKHYAGDVGYETSGFLEKNKDLVWTDLILVGESSSMFILKSMFPEGGSSSLGSKRPITAGAAFKGQVNDLMSTLSKCVPHYIRCIKPNDDKRSGFINAERMNHQIRYLGLLENVKVCRAGFVFRQSFEKFLQRYKVTHAETWPNFKGSEKDGCKKILDGVDVKHKTDYQFGKTMVFIKEPQSLFKLEAKLDICIKEQIVNLQALWRGFAVRSWYAKEKAAILIQAVSRTHLAGKQYKLHQAGFVLTKVVRAFLDMRAPIKQKIFTENQIFTKKRSRKSSHIAFPVQHYVPEIMEDDAFLLEKVLKKERKSDNSPFSFVDVGEKLGKKQFLVRKNRIFALTEKRLYEIEWTNHDKVRKAQSQKSTTKYPVASLKYHRSIEMSQVTCLSMSSKLDNFVVVHTNGKEGDFALILERKCEFVSMIMMQQEQVRLNINDNIKYKYKSRDFCLSFVDSDGKGFEIKPEQNSNPPSAAVVVGRED